MSAELGNEGCCGDATWRGSLCTYHSGVRDGIERAETEAAAEITRLTRERDEARHRVADLLTGVDVLTRDCKALARQVGVVSREGYALRAEVARLTEANTAMQVDLTHALSDYEAARRENDTLRGNQTAGDHAIDQLRLLRRSAEIDADALREANGRLIEALRRMVDASDQLWEAHNLPESRSRGDDVHDAWGALIKAEDAASALLAGAASPVPESPERVCYRLVNVLPTTRCLLAEDDPVHDPLGSGGHPFSPQPPDDEDMAEDAAWDRLHEALEQGQAVQVTTPAEPPAPEPTFEEWLIGRGAKFKYLHGWDIEQEREFQAGRAASPSEEGER